MRAWFLRLAFLAVLLNALAPSVSHALAAARPDIPVDVCSEHGGAELAVAAALLNQEQDHHHAGLLGDCGHCLAHAGSAGMPPPELGVLPLVSAPAERPYLFYHAPRPLPLLCAAAPRGPPTFA